MRKRPPFYAAVLFAALGSVSQLAPGQMAPGFRLLDQWQGPNVLLVDEAGTVVHTWVNANNATGGIRVLPDGTLMRPIVTTGPLPAGGACGGVQRLALDGSVLWDFRYDGPLHWTHHDIEIMPNGNVLLAAWENKTIADAVAAGRNPAILQGTVFRPDHVIEVQPTGPTTGTIVWEWHLFDHLIQQFDSTKANYGVVAQHPELLDINFPAVASQTGDWNHVNALHYDPVHDWLVINSPNQNEVWVVDHGTTTAQAAGHTGGARGHGGDFLYRWGNPLAYQAGTAADQKLFGQHGTNIIAPGLPGAGNFLLFNNNAPGGSQVVEFSAPVDASGNFILTPGTAYGPAAPVWTYSAPGFFSAVQGSARRAPNGNTLVASANQFRAFEVTPSNQEVWSYVWGTNRIFQAHFVERLLWADKSSVSGSAGGTVAFNLIAGTQQAGKSYFLLASASGTSPGYPVNGLVLPLNFDYVFDYTLSFPNLYPLSQSQGVLSATGRATAFLTLGPGLVSSFQGDFAFAAYDPLTLTVTRTSNPVPLTVGP